MQSTATEISKTIEGYRLSPQQEHLWSLQPENLPYRVVGTVAIAGEINPNFLKSALQKVVDRHEILRTNFQRSPGIKIPFQVIADSSKLSINSLDLSHLTLQEREAKIKALFNEALRSPFNLSEGLLLQASLITLSPTKSTLLLSLPAMNADSASLRNLTCEISRFYAAELRDEELGDEELMQYADIAEWQNELLEEEDGELGKAYWRQQEISKLLNLKLPWENSSRDRQEFQPEFLTVVIPANLTAQIEALAQKSDRSFSVFLLTCWLVLLWRLVGHSDILVGAAYDGRKYEELQQALGLFAKYLPIRCHLEATVSFSQVWQQINESAEEVYKWQEYFSWKQTVGGEKTFFPFSFEFEEALAKETVEDVTFAIGKQYACCDRFSAKLSCRRDEFLSAEFHYDANLFQQEDIERLAGQFQKLLESVVSNPETSIDELEILSDRERHQLLVEFNNTQIDYPQDKCIHHLFEEQVERTPNKIAVAFESQQLTYRELNDRANQLARHLQKQGVKPEVLVGICVERSLEMAIGILGILKAGGAYLPLDPAYPQERLAFALEDSAISILLTQQRLLKNLPERSAKTICLDADWQAIPSGIAALHASDCPDNLAVQITAENLAYVIYTSGSTGQPKGVQITHQNLVHSTRDRLTYYREPVVSFLLLSSFAFDSSIAGIFWSLCQGGFLCLPQEGKELEIPELIKLINQNRISHLLSLPSLYALLLEQAKPEKLASLSTVIVAGESCTTELVKRHLELLPETSLFNEYGPTEGTVWSSAYQCRSAELTAQIPIGRPIANTQIYILNSRLQPVPLGVAGELHVGGLGLARGYLNRPELNAEKFISNPFLGTSTKSSQSSVRLYKTGDLARYLSDGNIEFLGRVDRQVKIRGFRIELGEVEAALSQHPQVRAIAVIAREDIPGHKRLVAYIVANSANIQPSTLISDWRDFLKEKLPEYMVPSAFVRLKNLPRLPNGKVDVKALPAPEVIRTELSETFIAPNTSVEKLLAEIWSGVLRIEQVGIRDNFFELGGDSIVSIQIVARANQAGLQLTPKQLFDNPTIAKLAKVAGTIQTSEVEQKQAIAEVPLTPFQHWFFAQNLDNPAATAIVLEVPQTLNLALLESVVQHWVAHCDALRLRLALEETGWRQFLADRDEVVPVRRLDFSTLPEVEREAALKAAIASMQTNLNLGEKSLVRVALFELDTVALPRVSIVIHPLIADRISVEILIENFQTIWEQLSRGEAIHLPPTTTSFQQWAYRVSEYAHSTSLENELSYWFAESRQQVSQLPVDFPTDNSATIRTNTQSIALKAEETRFLLQELPKAYQTQTIDALLASLVQAFKKWTGDSRLLVDLETSGREKIFDDMDLSRTAGCFTNIFPMLLDLQKASEPGEALKAVKEQLRCLPNRGIGYGVLRYLSGDRQAQNLQALHQARIKFNYQEPFDSATLATLVEVLDTDFNSLENQNYLLVISGFINGERLQLNCSYSEEIYRQETIENLMENFASSLRSLIAHCQSPDSGGYTPSDFPKANLSQKDLDRFLSQINRTSKK